MDLINIHFGHFVGKYSPWYLMSPYLLYWKIFILKQKTKMIDFSTKKKSSGFKVGHLWKNHPVYLDDSPIYELSQSHISNAGSIFPQQVDMGIEYTCVDWFVVLRQHWNIKILFIHHWYKYALCCVHIYLLLCTDLLSIIIIFQWNWPSYWPTKWPKYFLIISKSSSSLP